VLMARLLDQDEFGLLVLALNLLLAAGTLAIAGADYATVRFVSAAPTPGEKRGAIVTPLLVVGALNVLVSVAVAALAEPISERLLDQPDFTSTLRALALVLPFTTLAQMFSAGLAGLERASGELARKVTEQAGRIVLAPVGLAGATLGMAAAAALAALVVGLLLVRTLPRGGRTQPIGAGKVVSFAWPQTVANAAGQLWEVAKVVILASSTGGRAVALYGAAIALARLPALIYNAFSYRVSPAISRLWDSGAHAELRDLLKGVTRWVAIVSVPLYGAALALPGPLLGIFGSEYEDAATALAVIAAGSLVNSLAGPVEWALIMTGRVKLEMVANVASLLALLPVALLVIPAYGLVGAAAMTTAYSLLLNALKTLFAERSLGMVPLTPTLAGPLAAGAIAAAAVAGLAAVTRLDSSLAGTALLCAALLGLYALLYVRVIGISDWDRDAIAVALGRTR
jgi:O-antigen/teichoic acid export membrane protein